MHIGSLSALWTYCGLWYLGDDSLVDVTCVNGPEITCEECRIALGIPLKTLKSLIR